MTCSFLNNIKLANHEWALLIEQSLRRLLLCNKVSLPDYFMIVLDG
jgi:hypothetical protein